MTLRSVSICCLLLALAGNLGAQQPAAPPAGVAAPAASAPAPGESADEIVKPGKDVTPPAILSKPEPKYTEEARKMKVSGVTTLMMTVDAHGIPQDVHVVASMADRVKPNSTTQR
jgi:protein TonB